MDAAYLCVHVLKLRIAKGANPAPASLPLASSRALIDWTATPNQNIAGCKRDLELSPLVYHTQGSRALSADSAENAAFGTFLSPSNNPRLFLLLTNHESPLTTWRSYPPPLSALWAFSP